MKRSPTPPKPVVMVSSTARDLPKHRQHWGLEAAREHLRALGAPEPEMPLFDESKFEPMVEVEI